MTPYTIFSLITVDLPYVGQVLSASKERPFLSLLLQLAPTLVGEVMIKASSASHPCATCNGCGKRRRIGLADEPERLQMVGALLSAHGFSCREWIQEQIAFPMLFRLHMRI